MSLHAHLEKALATVPFLATLGIRVEEARPGHVVLRLPYRDENTSHAGTVHSAALFAVGEFAASVALGTHPRLGTLTQLVKVTQIRYVLPTAKDVTAHATVTPEMVETVQDGLEKAGRALLEVPVQVLDGHGNDVADLLVGFAFRT